MSPSDKRQPLSILVVVAHPHDFTHMAGTCGKHVDMGDSVTVVSVTGGSNIHNEPLELELRKPVAERNMDIINESAEVYAGRKKHEMHEAAALFGITDVRVLPYMDNPLEVTRALEGELADVVYEVRPHMLLTHDPYGVATRGHANMGQDDHRDVGIAMQRALAIAGTPKRHYAAEATPHRSYLLHRRFPELPRLGHDRGRQRPCRESAQGRDALSQPGLDRVVRAKAD